MDEHPNWEEIHAQLKSARETLSADQRRRQSSSTIPQTPPIDKAKSADTPAAGIQARLEARARQRRIERRSAAARAAMQEGRLVEAQAALSEIQELDPSHPEVISLGRALGEAQFDETQAAPSEIQELSPSHPEAVLLGRALDEVQLNAPQAALAEVRELDLRHAEVISFEGVQFKEVPAARSEIQELDPSATDIISLGLAFDEAQYKRETRMKKGPALAAAAVLAIGLLASVQFAGFANLISQGSAQTLAFLTGNDSPAALERREPPAAALVTTPTNALQSPRPVEPAADLPAAAPVVASPPATSASIEAAEPLAAPPPHAEPALVTRDNSERLILEALDRYRVAYEKLDARSAQQIWPTVNEPALARASTGLRSEALTFDDCDVRISGDMATAACVGSTHYLPRVGSQQPRIESRIWDFTLRHDGADWKIESARVDR